MPSLMNYFEEPEKVIAEIIEMTYEDVGDVFGAIDAYGALLYEKKDWVNIEILEQKKRR